MAMFRTLKFSRSVNKTIATMERLGHQHNSQGWTFSANIENIPRHGILVDSLIKNDGKYSLSIATIGQGSGFANISSVIPKTFRDVL